MPFSARTRAAIGKTVVTLTATVALLGIADTATGVTTSRGHSTAATAQVDSASTITTMACPSCWT